MREFFERFGKVIAYGFANAVGGTPREQIDFALYGEIIFITLLSLLTISIIGLIITSIKLKKCYKSEK